MRLTKLYIHNYKSFYDTTIELDKMNIVVGENNSGKSNLIDVLEFIDIAMNKGIPRAITTKGGYKKIKNYNCDDKDIIIKYFFESGTEIIQDKTTSFTFKDNIENIKIRINEKSASSIIIRKMNILSEDFGYFSGCRREKFYFSSKKYTLKDSYKKDNKFLSKNKLEELLNRELFTNQLEYMKKTSKNLASAYSFNTETIRNTSHKESEKELKKDGSNLGKNLFHIKNDYPHTFELISNSMIGIVNEIDAVDVQETFGNYLIGFHEENKEIGIEMVSDGTINLLATITALNQEDDKSILLAFDEPERYLHLKAVNYLLESFRASKKQILITTHSTEILKYANLDEIVFIYRDGDGDTQSIRANKIDGLTDMLKELSYERDLTLDELIADGIIGDFK